MSEQGKHTLCYRAATGGINDEHGRNVARMGLGHFTKEEADAMGEFIVRACNSHHDLLEAGKSLLAAIADDRLKLDMPASFDDTWAIAIHKMQAAIAKGGKP